MSILQPAAAFTHGLAYYCMKLSNGNVGKILLIGNAGLIVFSINFLFLFAFLALPSIPFQLIYGKGLTRRHLPVSCTFDSDSNVHF